MATGADGSQGERPAVLGVALPPICALERQPRAPLGQAAQERGRLGHPGDWQAAKLRRRGDLNVFVLHIWKLSMHDGMAAHVEQAICTMASTAQQSPHVWAPYLASICRNSALFLDPLPGLKVSFELAE